VNEGEYISYVTYNDRVRPLWTKPQPSLAHSDLQGCDRAVNSK